MKCERIDHVSSVTQRSGVPYRAPRVVAWHSGAMTVAHLKGLSEDGTHVLLVAEDGAELRLEISDELRALVRHARVTRAVEPGQATSLTPREIQQRIRAGLNAAELAHLTGEPLEALVKFEAPVLAERAYIVQLAHGTRVGTDSTAPTLIDLVGDRLASRGVDADAVKWDAWRGVDEPWKVAADYVVGGRTIRAAWTFDHVAKALTAEDDEAAWLTETELLEAPIPRRHLSAVRVDAVPLEPRRPAAVTTTADEQGVPGESSGDHTDDLLEDLAARRGTREPIEVDEDEDDDEGEERFEGFGPARSTHSGALPTQAPQPQSRTMPHPAGSARTPQPDKDGPKPRKGRASVPSWDEIVFGARSDT